MTTTERQAVAGQASPHLLVLVTGRPSEPLRDRFGTFETMFEQVIRLRHPKNQQQGVRLSVYPLCDADEQADWPDPCDYDGVIITGSPAMVTEAPAWLSPGTAFVREAVARRVPTLGVCFGHQMLAHAMGCRVGPSPVGRTAGTIEVSHRGEDPLLATLPRRFPCQASHGEAVLSLGPGVRTIGEAAHDPYHMIKVGPRAWGVQFHPEFSPAYMKAVIEFRREGLEREKGAGHTDARLASLADTPVAREVLHRFVELVATERWEQPATDGR